MAGIISPILTQLSDWNKEDLRLLRDLISMKLKFGVWSVEEE